MGLGDWIKGLLRTTGPDDDAAEVEEYGGADPELEGLPDHPAPSFFGGVEPPDDGGLKPPTDLAP